jgi:WW domain-binding protein 11
MESKPAPPQKPSYVKSAASTVVKRPLAQHTPELTSMVSRFNFIFLALFSF